MTIYLYTLHTVKYSILCKFIAQCLVMTKITVLFLFVLHEEKKLVAINKFKINISCDK